MRFVDTHVHLSDPQYEAQIEKIIEDAKRSNVIALVSNSIDLQTSLQSIELTKEYPNLVYAALGIHPENSIKLLQNELEHTVDLIFNNKRYEKMVAIGEIGLDADMHYKPTKGKPQEILKMQYDVFCKMLQLSEKLSLPAIIHSRGTASEILDTLPSYNIKKVLLHWFSKPMQLLPIIVDRGYFITEGPAAIFSNHIQDIVQQIPLANLLTETDGPVRFFRRPFKGEMALPSHVELVVETIAKIKKRPKEEVAEQIYENFTTVFGINPHVS